MCFASSIVMVRPAAFGFNSETAVNNAFQHDLLLDSIQHKALEEFDKMVAVLRAAGITVIVIHDTAEPAKPDAVFPNNWFCLLPNDSLHLFPMYAPNRRLERRADTIEKLKQVSGIKNVVDWSVFEQQGRFLEGTGSMVFDHGNKIAYANISDRTDATLLRKFEKQTGYSSVRFVATDEAGQAIYHTNVMMCIGKNFCVACVDAIKTGREEFIRSFLNTGKTLVSINHRQMRQFAGNMLQLRNTAGEYLLVMSEAAFNSLTGQQRQQLEQYTQLLSVSIPTIETIGGGSARCMMAEIFQA